MPLDAFAFPPAAASGALARAAVLAAGRASGERAPPASVGLAVSAGRSTGGLSLRPRETRANPQATRRESESVQATGIDRDADRPVHLNPRTLESLTSWIDTYRLIHEQQFRRLDALLDTMKEEEK